VKLGFEGFCDLFEKRIKGEFAFGLFRFDSENILKEIVLGRDLVGVRPLYISQDSSNKYAESLCFASSLEAL